MAHYLCTVTTTYVQRHCRYKLKNQIYLKHKIWKKEADEKHKPNGNNNYKLRVLTGLKGRKTALT